MAKQKRDLYANKAIQRVTMSAANTLTFQPVNFAVGAFQGVALLIHRVNFNPSYGGMQELVANTDIMMGALTVSSVIADIAPTHPEIVAGFQRVGMVSGAPATGMIIENPIVQDFSNLPGGGILIPANPVYVAMWTSGFVALTNMDVVIDFTFVELSDADYIELLQSRIQSNI